ncbi:MAG: BatA domain-containing protein [Ferruginibacter sp.]|nr:BatA domain-containing protein [Cytophagales bacterium]
MIQLLAPFWLAALAGIAVPIAIHLWNKKPGRTVKVGSIRWLEAAASQRLRRLRPRDGWLLLLRIALVAGVALLLTQPQWRRRAEPTGDKWVLISPDLLGSKEVSKVRGLVDSLRRRGFQLRRYGPDFPPVSPPEWADPLPSGGGPNAADYWALVP